MCTRASMPEGAPTSSIGGEGGWLWRPLLGASLSQVVLGIVRPTVTYAGLEFGADSFMIGVIAASYAVLPMLVALPVGSAAGRLRHIGMLPFASGLLLIAACSLAAVAPSLGALTGASALLGVANLGVLVGAQAWISRSAAVAKYDGGFGWMTAGMSLGQAVGPLIAGALVGSVTPTPGGITNALWASAWIAALVAVVFISHATRTYDDAPLGPQMNVADIVRTSGVARYMVVSAAVLTSVDILTAYLPVIGASVGIGPLLIGAMLAVRGVTSTLSRLLIGPLSRRFSRSNLLIASTGGAALCLTLVAVVPIPSLMFAALALGGFFLGLGQPLTMTAVAVALPPRARASGLAVRLLGNRVAQTVTPILAGAVTAVIGVGAVLLLPVVGLAASAAWERTARRRDDQIG